MHIRSASLPPANIGADNEKAAVPMAISNSLITGLICSGKIAHRLHPHAEIVTGALIKCRRFFSFFGWGGVVWGGAAIHSNKDMNRTLKLMRNKTAKTFLPYRRGLILMGEEGVLSPIDEFTRYFSDPSCFGLA